MRISDLKPAPYNPRKIFTDALEGLKRSLKRFGDLSGIVFNKRTGHAGHQRVKALTDEYGEGVELKDGKLWTEDGQIPVREVPGHHLPAKQSPVPKKRSVVWNTELPIENADQLAIALAALKRLRKKARHIADRDMRCKNRDAQDSIIGALMEYWGLRIRSCDG